MGNRVKDEASKFGNCLKRKVLQIDRHAIQWWLEKWLPQCLMNISTDRIVYQLEYVEAPCLLLACKYCYWCASKLCLCSAGTDRFVPVRLCLSLVYVRVDPEVLYWIKYLCLCICTTFTGFRASCLLLSMPALACVYALWCVSYTFNLFTPVPYAL